MEGAAVCATLIYEQYGIKREAQATERHAQRIGIYMKQYVICVGCGARVRSLNSKTGYCPACHMKHNMQRERELSMQLEKEAREIENERKKYQREYDRLRQQNYRLCRSYGITKGNVGKKCRLAGQST